MLTQLLQYVVGHAPPDYYQQYNHFAWRLIQEHYPSVQPTSGVHEGNSSRLVLLEERCGLQECYEAMIPRTDRYGKCCNAYLPDDLSIEGKWRGARVFTIRDYRYTGKSFDGLGGELPTA